MMRQMQSSERRTRICQSQSYDGHRQVRISIVTQPFFMSCFDWVSFCFRKEAVLGAVYFTAQLRNGSKKLYPNCTCWPRVSAIISPLCIASSISWLQSQALAMPVTIFVLSVTFRC